MLHSRKILLIEEEAVLREVTEFRLELLGFQVAAVDSARSANERIQEQLPEMIVLGTAAETDSFEFLNHLSNDPQTSQIPVMVMSASSEMEDVTKAFNAGANEFLVIPYDPQMLETKVQKLFELTHVLE